MTVSAAESSVIPATSEILVVDDNVTVAQAVAELVRSTGLAAIVCTRGADALSYAAAGAPKAAVIDIHLSDLNGLVLAQKLRERFGPAIPIIVLSGDTSMETLRSLPHVGVTCFLSKPLSPTLFIERLRELVGEISKPEHA